MHSSSNDEESNKRPLILRESRLVKSDGKPFTKNTSELAEESYVNSE